MDRSAKIYVAGHTGLVGSAVVRRLHQEGFTNLLLRTRSELDLLDQRAVVGLFEAERPQYVIDCAAKVGGISANLRAPAEFLFVNLQIQNNLIWAAKDVRVRKFLFLGSSCGYPRDCPQPMREEHLLTGPPEPTNEGYAIAKIAGIKLCEHIHTQFDLCFISCMPTNIYGPYDNFDPETAHVIPSLIRRMHDAKSRGAGEIVVWGTGTSRREFLYVDDLADAVVWLLRHYDRPQLLNVGTGLEISIGELARLVARVVGFQGAVVFDPTRPDGMPRKLLDVSRLHAAGWRHRIGLSEGLARTYEWYVTRAPR